MGEIKPGDRVWAVVGTAHHFDGQSNGTPSGIVIEQPDGNFGFRRTGEFLPDHPALPAVARWLRETPEARDAVTHAIGVMIGQWRTIQRMRSTAIRQSNDAAQWDATEKAEIVWKKIAVLKALLAALEAGS